MSSTQPRPRMGLTRGDSLVIRVHGETYDLARQLAEHEGRTIGEVLRRAVTQYELASTR